MKELNPLFKEVKGAIRNFTGEYAFLSNDYPCKIVDYEGNTFTSAEAMFQSYKTRLPESRKEFTKLSPEEARNIGESIEKRPEWDECFAGQVMVYVIYQKFYQNPSLRGRLVETGGLDLIHGNMSDMSWGCVPTKVPIDNSEIEMLSGKNKLGIILKFIRMILTWKDCPIEKEQKDEHGHVYMTYNRRFGSFCGLITHHTFDDYNDERQRLENVLWSGFDNYDYDDPEEVNKDE